VWYAVGGTAESIVLGSTLIRKFVKHADNKVYLIMLLMLTLLTYLRHAYKFWKDHDVFYDFTCDIRPRDVNEARMLRERERIM